MNVAAYVAAAIVFVLAGLGVDVGAFSELDLVAFGLAALAIAPILPG